MCTEKSDSIILACRHISGKVYFGSAWCPIHCEHCYPWARGFWARPNTSIMRVTGCQLVASISPSVCFGSHMSSCHGFAKLLTVTWVWKPKKHSLPQLDFGQKVLFKNRKRRIKLVRGVLMNPFVKKESESFGKGKVKQF